MKLILGRLVLIFLLIPFGSELLLAQRVTNETSRKIRERKGFVLGFGIGAGTSSFNLAPSASQPSRESKTAFMTDFRIGYAPSNQFAIFWNSKSAWFGLETPGYHGSGGENATYVSSLAGVGFSYFLNSSAPTLFFDTSIGYSGWGELYGEAASGWGGALGLGYEFSKHWSANLNFTAGNPKSDYWGFHTFDTRITLNYLMY